MPPKPKIHTEEHINLLKKLYLEDKWSTNDIKYKSVELFGVFVSNSTIYKELLRHNIPVRSKSESVSIATATLDYDISYLNNDMIEWIDGFLLGDGGARFCHNEEYSGARFSIGTSSPEWTKYAMSKFNCYMASDVKIAGKIDAKHPNYTYYSTTLRHPDIIQQAKRWYSGPNYKKKVPKDVRITPTSMMLWYLGDGSIHYTEENNATSLRFATCSFEIDDVENILMPKLEELGLRCKREKWKNDIRICADTIDRFFEIIGRKSPIECYDYKFKMPEWLGYTRLSDIVKNDREKWKVQKWYKYGKIDCIKSPGGRMLLFTKEQAEELRNRLDDRIRYS